MLANAGHLLKDEVHELPERRVRHLVATGYAVPVERVPPGADASAPARVQVPRPTARERRR